MDEHPEKPPDEVENPDSHKDEADPSQEIPPEEIIVTMVPKIEARAIDDSHLPKRRPPKPLTHVSSTGALETARLGPVVSTFLGGFATVLIIFSLGSDVKVSAWHFLGLSSKGLGQLLLGIAVVSLLFSTEFFVNSVSKPFWHEIGKKEKPKRTEDELETDYKEAVSTLLDGVLLYNFGLFVFFAGAAILISENSLPVTVIFGIGGFIEFLWFCRNLMKRRRT